MSNVTQADLDKIARDYSFISSRTQEAMSQNDILTSQNKDIENRMGQQKIDYKSSLEEIATKQGEVKKITKDISNLTQDHLLLSKKARILNEEVNDLSVAKSLLVKEISELDAKYSSLKKDVEKKRDELDVREKTIDTNEMTLSNYKEELLKREAILQYREGLYILDQKAGK